MKKVFISYAREDIEVAERLYSDLKEAGLEPWMDEEDLLPGQHWEMTVTDAIKDSSYFLALLSESSVSKRGFVQQELKIALKLLDRSNPKDIFIIPLRLDKCRPVDERLQLLHRVDLFRSYEKGLDKILRVLCPDSEPQKPQKPVTPAEVKKPATDDTADRIVKTAVESVKEKPEVKPEAVSMPGEVYKLRSESRELSDDDVRDLIKKHNFYSGKYNLPWDNSTGNFRNDFRDNGNGTITDSVTGLVWEKSGSPYSMPFSESQDYIDGLNKKKFAGYDDWRLPTLEELASLLENKKVDGLYIDPLFDRKQKWCWTADTRASGGAWNVYFRYGYVDRRYLEYNRYVRGVRSRTI